MYLKKMCWNFFDYIFSFYRLAGAAFLSLIAGKETKGASSL
jgi:hypothetical protein